jgi:hypothetical protein
MHPGQDILRREVNHAGNCGVLDPPHAVTTSYADPSSTYPEDRPWFKPTEHCTTQPPEQDTYREHICQLGLPRQEQPQRQRSLGHFQ